MLERKELRYSLGADKTEIHHQQHGKWIEKGLAGSLQVTGYPLRGVMRPGLFMLSPGLGYFKPSFFLSTHIYEESLVQDILMGQYDRQPHVCVTVLKSW